MRRDSKTNPRVPLKKFILPCFSMFLFVGFVEAQTPEGLDASAVQEALKQQEDCISTAGFRYRWKRSFLPGLSRQPIPDQAQRLIIRHKGIKTFLGYNPVPGAGYCQENAFDGNEYKEISYQGPFQRPRFNRSGMYYRPASLDFFFLPTLTKSLSSAAGAGKIRFAEGRVEITQGANDNSLSTEQHWFLDPEQNFAIVEVISMFKEHVVQRAQVTEHEEIEINGVKIPVPRKVITQDYEIPRNSPDLGNKRSEQEYELEAFAINENYPDASFQLSPPLLTLGRKTFVESWDRSLFPIGEARRSLRTTYIVVGSILIVLLLAGPAIVSRRRGGSA